MCFLFQFKAEIEQKSGKNFVTYEAVEYKTQLVAGVNFFVKVIQTAK